MANRIYGSNVGNFLFGTAEDDAIYGWAPTNPPRDEGPPEDGDYISAGDGNDLVYGGAGNDRILGGRGSDRLVGGEGDDVLFGSGVDDDVSGSDTILGGAGNDQIFASLGPSSVVNGGSGDDEIHVFADSGGRIDGSTGIDSLRIDSDTAGILSLGTLTIRNVEILYTQGNTVAGSVGQFASFRTITRSPDDTVGEVRLSLQGTGGTLNLSDKVEGRPVVVFGTAYKDVLTLGEGADSFVDTGGDDTVYGGGGADILEGRAGDDMLYGGSGADLIGGGIGNDRMYGGTEDDDLRGNDGNDLLEGGRGADKLDGQAGSDTASYASSSERVTVRLLTGIAYGGDAQGDTLAGIENLTGSVFDDDLAGDNGANVLDGGRGSDELTGNGGADTLIGGDGNDRLEGGAGADRLVGGGGLFDLVTYEGSDTGVSVNLATGQGRGGEAEGDTLSGIEQVIGSDFSDILTGSSGADAFVGGLGADVFVGSAGADYIIGNDGSQDGAFAESDRVTYKNSTAGVRVELYKAFEGGPAGQGGDAEGDRLIGISAVTGSAHDDVLTGYAGPDAQALQSVYAGGIPGRFDGGAGNDTIQGGYGDDVLIGGSGIDTVSYSLLPLDDLRVDLGGGTATGNLDLGLVVTFTDSLSGFENVTGSVNGDTLIGSTGANRISAGRGNDTLVGGRGADDLFGGLGRDTFQYAAATDSGTTSATRDTIYDFSQTENDRIRLISIDANTDRDGNQDFSFIGQAAFTGRAGQLRYEKAASDTYIYGDRDGNGKADFSIHLDDAITLARADFVL